MAHRSFGRYWLVLRPFVGYMLSSMLKQIKAEAECMPATGDDGEQSG